MPIKNALIPIFILGFYLASPIGILQPALKPALIHAELASEGFNSQTLPPESCLGDENGEINTHCSCIKSARNAGVNIPWGTNAEDLKPNSTPVVGGLVLFKYPNSHHVAVIQELSDAIYVYEGNFEEGKETYRKVAYDDEYIRGFWSAERYALSGAQKAP